MANQGKCKPCRIRWLWKGDRPLPDCPECNQPMAKATTNNQYTLKLFPSGEVLKKWEWSDKLGRWIF